MDRMDKNDKDKEKYNEKYNEKMRRNGEKEFGRDVYGGILDPQNPDDIANYSLNATSDENDYNESVVTYGTGNGNGNNGNGNNQNSYNYDTQKKIPIKKPSLIVTAVEKQMLSPRNPYATPLVVLPRASHQPKQISPFGLRRQANLDGKLMSFFLVLL